jgi:hypothetical protein
MQFSQVYRSAGLFSFTLSWEAIIIIDVDVVIFLLLIVLLLLPLLLLLLLCRSMFMAFQLFENYLCREVLITTQLEVLQFA